MTGRLDLLIAALLFLAIVALCVWAVAGAMRRNGKP
jgi:hypothetical protein